MWIVQFCSKSVILLQSIIYSFKFHLLGFIFATQQTNLFHTFARLYECREKVESCCRPLDHQRVLLSKSPRVTQSTRTSIKLVQFGLSRKTRHKTHLICKIYCESRLMLQTVRMLLSKPLRMTQSTWTSMKLVYIGLS